jgi:hypothetical protein
MPTPVNNFLPFAIGVGAEVLTQAEYEALTTMRANGFTTGTALAAQLNKVWRQSSTMSAVLAQAIADLSGQDVLDDGTTATILTNLKSILLSLDVANTWLKGQSGTVLALPATTGSVAPNFTLASNFSSVLTGDVVFTNSFTGPGAGKATWFVIDVIQPASGTLRNWSFGTLWKLSGGASSLTALTQAFNARDQIVGQVCGDGSISFAIRPDVKS